MNSLLGRRSAIRLMAAAAAAGAASLALAHDRGDEGHGGLRHNHVFTSTNSPAGNELLVFSGGDDAAPSLQMRVPTQGLGTGAGLGSQGAVTLSGSGRFLFVVNARSNTVSTFALGEGAPVLRSVVDSGGLTPTSVAENDGLVYVLNAGGAGNVAGFRNQNGTLVPLADGQRALSAAGGTAPAQVGFDRDGDVLVVSERNTNVLSVWPVSHHGTLGARSSRASPGLTPFGFAVTARNVLVVSEAAAGAALGSSTSSYRIGDAGPNATLQLRSAAVPTTQTAACWAAVTPDGRHAFIANAGSSSISRYAIGHDGGITLQAAQAALTGPNAGALDLAVPRDGRSLHVLAPRSLQVLSYRLAADGTLTPLGAAGGLPMGSAGMAAN